MQNEIIALECAGCGACYMGIVNEAAIIRANSDDIIEAIANGDTLKYMEADKFKMSQCTCNGKKEDELSEAAKMEAEGYKPLFPL